MGAARDGVVEHELFSGGNFTITNIGMLPIHGITPLPNSPQIAILGVGAARPVPVEVDGRVETSNVACFTLAMEHRALDGMTSARFLVAIKDFVELPAGMGYAEVAG